MFNLQESSFDISKGIQEDLDMQMIKSGITISGFTVMSFSYPKEIQDMITKNASLGMVSDVGRYQQISLTDGMASGKMSGGGAASDMAGMVMGMNIAGQMMNQMNQNSQNQPVPSQSTQPPAQPLVGDQMRPNFCPNCGTKTGVANFCSNCGQKLI
jgi:membrane protease subunit (stomatin/prohibitin family)